MKNNAQSVRDEIARTKPESILVLGTSEEMVDRIMDRLGLEKPPEDSPRRIKIEDITTQAERRRQDSKGSSWASMSFPHRHCSLRETLPDISWIRFGFSGERSRTGNARSSGRPYSYMGQYLIAERVIDDIIGCIAAGHPAAGESYM